MEPGQSFVFLLVLALAAVAFGAINLAYLKSFKSQKEEAERIFRQRVINGEEETILELKRFFGGIKKRIFLSALNFASAFVLFTTVAKRLWPSDSIPKTLLSVGILLLIFGGPILMLTLANLQTFFLKKDIMRRFDGE